MKTLDELGKLHSTDKNSDGWNYLHFYDRNLSHIRNDKITLLEIGVLHGNSLRMWRDYFPNGKIVGMDWTPSAAAKTDCIVEQGDQSKREDLERVVGAHGPFDIVVDDAGHVPPVQVSCYEYLIRHLNPGGYYILEDVDPDLCRDYAMGPEIYPGAAVDHLINVAKSVLSGPLTMHNVRRDPSPWDIIESISFYRRTSITRIRADNWLGMNCKL